MPHQSCPGRLVHWITRTSTSKPCSGAASTSAAALLAPEPSRDRPSSNDARFTSDARDVDSSITDATIIKGEQIRRCSRGAVSWRRVPGGGGSGGGGASAGGLQRGPGSIETRLRCTPTCHSRHPLFPPCCAGGGVFGRCAAPSRRSSARARRGNTVWVELDMRHLGLPMLGLLCRRGTAAAGVAGAGGPLRNACSHPSHDARPLLEASKPHKLPARW